MSGETVHGRGAGTGLANTAKYGDGGDIFDSGLATDETLVGHE